MFINGLLQALDGFQWSYMKDRFLYPNTTRDFNLLLEPPYVTQVSKVYTQLADCTVNFDRSGLNYPYTIHKYLLTWTDTGNLIILFAYLINFRLCH